jgi:hypothetical protein
MDRNVLKTRMRERFEAAMEATLKAVEDAPDGQWIAGSEWQVREVFERLTAECFREAMQGRIDAQASAKQASFSPDGKSGSGVAQQRGSQRTGVDRRW